MATKNEKHVELSDAQLLAMCDKLGYTNSIVGSNMGWALKALTVAHCTPLTHIEAIPVAIRLTQLLRKGYKAELWPSVPKLHYATKTGGIASPFKGSYNPARFGERTRLGESWALHCENHKQNYSKCDTGCRIVVMHNGQPAYTEVKKATKVGKQANAPKKAKVVKPNIPSDANPKRALTAASAAHLATLARVEGDERSEATQATIDALKSQG